MHAGASVGDIALRAGLGQILHGDWIVDIISITTHYIGNLIIPYHMTPEVCAETAPYSSFFYSAVRSLLGYYSD